MSSVDRDVNVNITADIKDFEKKVRNATKITDDLGDELIETGNDGRKGMQTLTKAANKTERDLAAVAVSVQGIADQVTGMSDQILSFQEKIVALERSTFGLKRTQTDYQRQLEDLTMALQEGELSTLEYERAIEDLRLAFIDMRIEQKEVAAETQALNGEFVTFGVSTAGTAAQIIIAFKAMGISAASVFPAIIAGIRGVSTAMWTIAKHPVFLIITAGIAAWELGLRHIVQELTGIEDLSIFSNIQTFFEDMIPTATENVAEINMEFDGMEQSLRKIEPALKSDTEALEEFGNVADSTAESVRGLTVSQELLKRSGGFRAGPGKPLSKAINEEADKIDAATARTLAAASLHHALQDAGITGSVFGRNISGNLTTTLESMKRAGRANASSFSNAGSVFGNRTGGVFFGGNSGLTRSTARRRRNRNPLGRQDKLSEILRERTHNIRSSRQDLFDFTGVSLFGSGNNFQFRRFSGNGGENRDDMRRAIFSDFDRFISSRLSEANRRKGVFDSAFGGKGNRSIAQAGLALLGHDKFDVFSGRVSDRNLKRIKTGIDAGKFFSSEGFGNANVLTLDVITSGYREMDDQLAFRGKERFQTVGT